ncbi:Tox-REase-5 domain-containing protein [Streptomyces sp. NPDC058221]|uniref:Tox-REase-5 domain-containing protein n=1 Tax=Streptomyces sp. NPDC058221 TaxID=3346388 RepID=UPI0036EF28C5
MGIAKPVGDGWDSSRQTFLKARNGYGSYLVKGDSRTLTDSGRDKFVAEATRQVEASGGHAVERHFSDPNVAKAARKAFGAERLPITVPHTTLKPAGPRKPVSFD